MLGLAGVRSRCRPEEGRAMWDGMASTSARRLFCYEADRALCFAVAGHQGDQPKILGWGGPCTTLGKADAPMFR